VRCRSERKRNGKNQKIHSYKCFETNDEKKEEERNKENLIQHNIVKLLIAA
jgi:hypothetical protein